MAETIAQRGAPPRLSDLLVHQPGWTTADRLSLFRSLVLQVQALHEKGQTHRAVHPDAVTVDRRLRPQLDAPARWQDLVGDDWDPRRSPPELANAAGLRLPSEIDAATGLLRERGLALDPRQVDVYQLGTLLCHLLTGRPVVAYMYDPTVKSGIPKPMRPLLERALGEGDQERFPDCRQLLAELDAVVRGLPGQSLHGPTRETPAEPGAISSSQQTPAVRGSVVLEPPGAGDLPFKSLGQFRIVARVGRGGMGDVYKAVDQTLDRDVAIKVLPPELTRDPEFVRRFRAEATAVAQLAHPNIVPIYTIGEDAGYHFFAMQLVEGEPLAERLAQLGRLPPSEALEIIKQCLAGLGAAHGRGLIHRDVKPGNILLDARTGLAMLVDFGLVRVVSASARVTAAGVIMGTPDYLAPEQALGEPVDGRADLYSLGVLAYELLVGRLPFEADSAMAMIYQHAHGKPQPLWKAAPDVPRAVADIIARMMAKRPEDRYPNAEEALADIRAFEAGEAISVAVSAGQRSFVAQAPDLEATPELPQSTARWLKPRGWQSLQERALSLFHRHAPEIVKELQTTEQLVDAAVAEHQRRHDKLARLVAEAEEILFDLAERRQSYLGAIEQAEQQVTAAADEGQKERAGRNLAHCRQAAVDVGAQHERFEEELADLRVRKAQANAKLLELVNQRDVLQARLKAARAEVELGGRRAQPRRVPHWMIAGFALVVLAATLRVYLWWSTPQAEDLPEPSVDTLVATTPPTESRGATAPIPVPPPSTVGGERTDSVVESHTWQGSLPAYVLRFSGSFVEFDLSGLDRRWLSEAYTAELLVKFDSYRETQWVTGNLDTRASGQRKAGWALLLLPADVPEDAGDTIVVKRKSPGEPGRSVWRAWSKRLTGDPKKLRRLAFAYATTEGTVRRIAGPPFPPGDHWWEIAVSRSPENGGVMIVLGKVPYLDEPTDGMLLEPSTTRFWLGAPWFVGESLNGQVAGFSLHRAGYAGRSSAGAAALISLDFSIPREDMVFDKSGWGHHGRFLKSHGAGGPSWLLSPERLPAAYKDWSPRPGKAFVVGFGLCRSVELLRTEGMFGLDDDFTIEMWLRDPFPSGERVLLSSAVEANPATTGYRHAGWSLVLSDGFNNVRTLGIRYPAGSQSLGNITSKEFPWGPEWHHVALCNASSRRQIYVDGKPLLAEEHDQANAILDNWVPSPASLTLGERGQCASEDPRSAGTQIRDFRLSSGRRYHQEFTPSATFTRDAETAILLDIAHRTGQLIEDLSGNRHDGLLLGAFWDEDDKTW